MEIIKINTKANEIIKPGKINLGIGSNNSGKSLFLRELHGTRNQNTKIITNMSFSKCSEIKELHPSRKIVSTRKSNDSIILNLERLYDYRNQNELILTNDQYNNPDLIDDHVKNKYKEHFISLFTSESRFIQVSKFNNSNNRNLAIHSIIPNLFTNYDKISDEVKKGYKNIFQHEIEFNDTSLNKLFFNVDKELPDVKGYERSVKHEKLSKYPTLDEQGDGFKAVANLMIPMLSLKNEILLIDEPEAFLHPKQAYQFGKWMNNNFSSQLFIMTHNSNFLSGVLDGDKAVDIFRFARKNENTKITKMANDKIKKLTHEPLLSSQPIKEALFHDLVILCEGDTDRIFYQTVYNKINEDNQLLFIHSLGKQNMKKIVPLFKDINLNFRVIMDFDIFDNKEEFKNLVESMDANNLSDITKQYDTIFSDYNESDWKNNLKEKGIRAIKKDQIDSTKLLINRLKESNILVVPNGELESWNEDDEKISKENWLSKTLGSINTMKIPDDLKIFLSF